jgi:glycerophosphoryl diester phosphodiesterase
MRQLRASRTAIALGLTLALFAGQAPADDDDRGRNGFHGHGHAHKKTPLVIGHRGASGYRPEHTLVSYRLAIQQGADFIEPDLVATKDGRLVTRHEPVLAIVQLDATGQIVLDANGKPIVLQETTNVAELPQFADKLAVKMLDGFRLGGWFTEDFTLAEIKTLRARERIPATRPANTKYNDKLEIPTLEEVIDLVKEVERETGKKIGIYPETKHPTYFAKEGTRIDGTPIDTSLGTLLIDVLRKKRFTDPKRVFIQSFEFANLIELQKSIMPAARVNLPLVQLYDDIPALPYDMHYNALNGANLAAIYGGLAGVVSITPTTTYGDLLTEPALVYIARAYAEGIGPWKNTFLLREPLTPPIDGNGDGNAQIATRLTGAVAPYLQIALDQGLEVHPYTLRAEEEFLTANPDGTPQNVVDEALQLYELGVTGFFIDQPVCGDIARDIFVKLQKYHSPAQAKAERARLLRSFKNPECFGRTRRHLAGN